MWNCVSVATGLLIGWATSGGGAGQSAQPLQQKTERIAIAFSVMLEKGELFHFFILILKGYCVGRQMRRIRFYVMGKVHVGME